MRAIAAAGVVVAALAVGVFLHPWIGAGVGGIGVVVTLAGGRHTARTMLAIAVVATLSVAAWLLYALNSAE